MNNREIKFRNWDGKKMSAPFRSLDVTHTEVMQFTGLLDMNGKEIYEGDILDRTDWCNGTLGDKPGIVIFDTLSDSDGYNACEYLCWIAGDSSLTDVHSQAEIIGNVWENPELLK